MQIDLWEIIKDTVLFFLDWWPVWVILLIGVAVKLIFISIGKDIDEIKIHRRFKKGEKWRSDRDLLRWIRGMNPSEFEKYIADLFTRLGYDAKAVGQSHDGGIDVVAEKDGTKNYIQCKKFITSKVSVGDVRDFYGALADHLASGKGYFITTNVFTLEASQFAEDKPIELIDGPRLVQYIRMTEKNTKKSDKEPSINKKPCPQCEGKLVQRKGKYGMFYGCSNFPKCTYTAPLKND